MEKTMRQLQQEVDEYIGQFKEGYFSPLAMLARLTEELGELAREVNHYYGKNRKRKRNKKKRFKKNWAIYFCTYMYGEFVTYRFTRSAMQSCINFKHEIVIVGRERKRNDDSNCYRRTTWENGTRSCFSRSSNKTF